MAPEIQHLNAAATEGPAGIPPDDAVVAPEEKTPVVTAPAPEKKAVTMQPREDGRVYDVESDSWILPEEMARRKAALEAEANTPDPDAPQATEIASGEPMTLDLEMVPSEYREEAVQYSEEIGTLAKECGLPALDAQRLFDHAMDLVLSDNVQIDVSNRPACEAELRSRWGEAYEAKVKVVADFVAKFPPIQAYLDKFYVGNHPGVNQALYEYASGSLRMTPKEAKVAIDALREEMMANPKKVNSKDVTSRSRALHVAAYDNVPEEEVAATLAKSPEALRAEQLTAEANDLRAKIFSEGKSVKDANAESPLSRRTLSQRTATVAAWKARLSEIYRELYS